MNDKLDRVITNEVNQLSIDGQLINDIPYYAINFIANPMLKSSSAYVT